MKKYIAFIVALVLLVAAIFVPQASANGVKAGKGDGDSDEFEDLKDLQKMDLDDGATFYISGERSFSISSSRKGSQSSNKGVVVFNAEWYVTSKAQYIVCDATIYEFSSMEDDNYDIEYSGAKASSISFEIFESSKKELIRINKFDAVPTVYDQTAVALYLGKWVEDDADFIGIADLAWDYADLVEEAMGLAMDVLSIDEDDWDESGKKLTLDEDYVEEVAIELLGSVNEDDDEYKGKVQLSFADKDAPKISVSVKANFADEDESGKVDYKSGANYAIYELVLTNVDNTDIDENIDKKDIITEKEMKKALKNTGLWDKYIDVDDDEEEEDDE